jgi:hypothetical protein
VGIKYWTWNGNVQLLAHGRWFSACTPASSTTKTGRHDIAEILLKVALNTKNQSHVVIQLPNSLSHPGRYLYTKYVVRCWKYSSNLICRLMTYSLISNIRQQTGTLNTNQLLVEQELLTLPEHLSSPPVWFYDNNIQKLCFELKNCTVE